MNIRFGHFGPIDAIAISADASEPWASETIPASVSSRPSNSWNGRFILGSDVHFHLLRNGTVTPSTGARVPANTLVEIRADEADYFTFCKATGADDGTVWITKVP